MDVFSMLKSKNPFIYEIDGELYYLGQWTCVHVENGRRSNYEEYKRLVREFDKDKDRTYMDKLFANFKNIVMSSHPLQTEGDNGSLKHFIEELSESEKKSLENQVEDFIRVHRYFYER